VNIEELKLKQEIVGIAQAAVGFVVVVLVLTGIGGTIYKIIAPNGWIALAFGRSLSAGVAALGSLLVVVALSWFSRGWSSPVHRNRASDLLVYGFAVAGFLYLAQFFTKGSF
jgi:hypothetical protein